MTHSGKIFECKREILYSLVKESKTYSEVLRKMGLSPVGNNRYNLKEKIKYENINDLHMLSNSGLGWSSGRSLVDKKDILKYFTPSSTMDRASIKKYILRFNLIPYVCKKCSCNPVWNNEKLILDLDHINGIRNDHTLENLRFLCPNCHSQEPTSNRRIYQKFILIDDVKRYMKICKTKREILKKLNVAECGTNYKRLNELIKECEESIYKI